MSTNDNISGVDIYQIMDEEVDKKLEEAQEVDIYQIMDEEVDKKLEEAQEVDIYQIMDEEVDKKLEEAQEVDIYQIMDEEVDKKLEEAQEVDIYQIMDEEVDIKLEEAQEVDIYQIMDEEVDKKLEEAQEVDIYQIMDEEVDKKLEEAQEVDIYQIMDEEVDKKLEEAQEVDIYQIMDEEVDKKLEEAQEFIKLLIVQPKLPNKKKQLLLRNLQGLICDFADQQPSMYSDTDKEIEKSRYEEKLRKIYKDYFIIRYKKCGQDKCQTCRHATVTTVSDNIIPPQCTSRVSGDTYDCKYEFDKSEIQGREPVVTCTTKNVIFLLTCQDCGEQFVGQTGSTSSLKSRDLLRDNDVKKHFSLNVDQNEEDSDKEEGQQSDKCEKFKFQIIQKLPVPGSQTDDKCIDKDIERDQWIKKLMTYYPYGMNSRLKKNERPLYSKKFFDLLNGSSITSRKNKDEIVKELLIVLDSEDSRPISNLDSVLNIIAQNTNKNVRLDVKNEYIDGKRNISNKNEKLDDLIKDVLSRCCGVKYEACNRMCETCKEVEQTPHCSPSFKPNEKHDCIYEFSEGEEMIVSCTTKNIIYLLTCKQCEEQYVGYASIEFKIKMNNHRSTGNTGQGPSETRKHFYQIHKDCPIEKFCSKIIQKIPGFMDKKDLTENLKRCKQDWIEKLETLKPYGMNVNTSGSKLSDKSSITGHRYKDE